ncbi:MAG: carboxylating nicotinate-nucleotide diphosphorylase [Cyclobacteriaceae bacterium]
MRPWYVTDEAINHFIETALAEDIGEGDHSSLASVPEKATNKAALLIKDDGVIAGLELAEAVFKHFDSSLKIVFHKKDGDTIKKGETAFEVSGSARSILATERLVLNCMQRMSGIASYTQKLCKLTEGTPAKLMDTRKTTPNFRLAEKWAVHIGGGMNHRFALYDMIMLKDNHIDMAGGIGHAIRNTREYITSTGKKLKVEIETRTLKEVQEVVDIGGVDIIMLDNMDVPTMRQALNLIQGKYKTEASGGITEKTLRSVAECGVDYISIGALTHSVRSLDLSLKVVE